MNRQFHTILLFLLALVAFSLPTRAQSTYRLITNDTLTINVVDTILLYDDGGPTGNYSNNFNGYAHLVSLAPMMISGTVNTESCCDYLYIYNGSNSTGSMLVNRAKGTDTISTIVSAGNEVFVFFHSDGSVVRDGIEIMAVPLTSVCPSMIGMPAVSAVGEHSATITWPCFDTNSIFRLIVSSPLSSDTIFLDTNYYQFSNLESGTSYSVRVNDTLTGSDFCSRTVRFRTLCSNDDFTNLDFTNLDACPVICTIGDFDNPYSDTLKVDHGYLSKESRHTVVTDTTALDSCTNYLLRMVPPGETASVRLGNWKVGRQAESISYQFRIDTTKSDLLILRYSAVLENPNHSATEQPKFTFKIADSAGQSLSSCYEAEFISSASLGWNTITGSSSTVLYKDWTTVGANLSPLHGQLITITLTTYDCSASAHYGYAYFTLGLANKRIYSDQCGNVAEYTFHVPDGFTYRWYNINDSTAIIGTQSTITISQAGTYNCEIGFVGNPGCSFTLQAQAGPRYPHARFDTAVDTSGCQYRVNFLNTSVIATDSSHSQLTTLPCEDYLWIIDDTLFSTQTNTSHVFIPGHHTARLVAYLGNFGCSDTSTWEFDVVIPNHAHHYDTMCDNHSYTFLDSTFYLPGEYILIPHPTVYCDTIHHLHLSTWPTYETDEFDTICYGDNSFIWHDGQNYNANTSTPQIILPSAEGCDSLVHLHLHIDTTVLAVIRHSGLFLPRVSEEGDKVHLTDASHNSEGRIWEVGNDSFRDPSIYVDYYHYTTEESLLVTLVAIGPQPRQCTDTTQICIYSIHPEIWAPNCFTPHSDNNNRWFLVGRNINTVGVHIYDRDGMEVCHLTSMNQYWDGRNMHGRECKQGSYAYRVFYTTIADPTTTHSFTGSILLLE